MTTSAVNTQVRWAGGRRCFAGWLLMVVLVSLSGLVGCRPTPVPAAQMIAGQTMGTTYSIKLVPSPDMPPLEQISTAVQRELDQVNAQMSTYQPTSELSQFNQSPSTDWFSVSPELAEVVLLSLQIYEQSQGAFDVTVGPLVDLWGFGPDQRPTKLPTPAQIDEILQWGGSAQLEARLTPPALRKRHPNLRVDLSAIAKGHGVDRVARVLDGLGLKAYFVEVGGEIRTRGQRSDGQPWQAGIERPVPNERGLQQVVGLSDQALATSGNYRNFFELEGRRFSHTINPNTGWPVEDDIVSASVVADNCALADGVATSMMSAGFTRGLELAEKHGWAVYLMRAVNPADPGGELEVATSSTFDTLFPDIAAELR